MLFCFSLNLSGKQLTDRQSHLCRLHVTILAVQSVPGSQHPFRFLFRIKMPCLLCSIWTQSESREATNGSLCTLIMCNTWFLLSCVPVNSLDIRNSHFPPSLFLSSSLIGWAPSCPVGVGLSLLLPVFFFFSWKWKLTKALKPCRRVFSHCW